MLRTRVVTAVVLLAAFLAALFLLPPWGWSAFALLVVAVAAHEWGALARLGDPGRIAYAVAIALAAAAILFATGLGGGAVRHAGATWLYVAAAAFWLFGATAWLRALPEHPATPLVLVLGSLVLLPTCAALVALRNAGPWILLMFMAVAWIADIAAYFTGRAFGRRKLAPRVSPGKTWEGVIGAFAATTAYALVLRAFLHVELRPALLAGLAVVVFVWVLTAASIVGDLLESALKRQAGLKDSGTLLPGHGGVLDRIDALTSVLPLAALAVAAGAA
jgi:phosphatidate cytidylyltransferase